MELKEFSIENANTCSACGKRLDGAVYAVDLDAVRAGLGICKDCVNGEEKPVRSGKNAAGKK